jgi:exo-beta-1,3-glucanase (GH17 family)
MRGISTAALATLLLGAPLAFARDDGHGTPPSPIDLAKQAWHGNALSYSGYRAGQSPETHAYPTQEQVREDLRILARNWRVLRVYAANRHAQDVLEVIRREKLPLVVMLGIWIDGRPDHVASTAAQVAEGIRMANDYKDVVVAVNVGDEALASWSAHKTTEAALLEQVRTVKQALRCPVTVADDWAYWREPTARLVDAVDFIAMHSYPVWNKHDVDTAMPFTISNYESVRKAHPGKTIVITQAGWPSETVGEPFVPGAGSEQKQKRYYDELTAWAKASGVTVFVFEAFDEPWKGSGTEGHWGLFTEGRRAKAVMKDLFPDLR